MQMASSLKLMLLNNEATAIDYTEKVLDQELSGDNMVIRYNCYYYEQ
jgi:hypothetical protein